MNVVDKLILRNISLAVNSDVFAIWKIKAGLVKIWNANKVLSRSRSDWVKTKAIEKIRRTHATIVFVSRIAMHLKLRILITEVLQAFGENIFASNQSNIPQNIMVTGKAVLVTGAFGIIFSPVKCINVWTKMSFGIFTSEKTTGFVNQLTVVKGAEIGETVDDWENVYESYNQVRQSLFYNSQMSQPTDKGNSKLEMPESRLQFFAFNKALMIGDEPNILAKLEAIFHEMKALNFSPEDVKHVSFLLFSDIYRQFPILNKMTYLSMVKTIHESQSIDRILSELQKVLNLTNKSRAPEKRYSDLVSETIDCVRQEYHQELTLKDIANRLHVNGVYLGQCFKNETERSFAQYLNQVCIQKAQQLLLYTNQSINEIAYKKGYNTNHYFIKMFKKLNGLSPKEFRERYKDSYQAIKGEQ